MYTNLTFYLRAWLVVVLHPDVRVLGDGLFDIILGLPFSLPVSDYQDLRSVGGVRGLEEDDY